MIEIMRAHVIPAAYTVRAAGTCDEAQCPHCGETRQIEFDARLQAWFCSTCGRTWKAQP